MRIASNDEFRVGSVFVADMLHVPFGVSHECYSVSGSISSQIIVFCLACLVVTGATLAGRYDGWVLTELLREPYDYAGGEIDTFEGVNM